LYENFGKDVFPEETKLKMHITKYVKKIKSYSKKKHHELREVVAHAVTIINSVRLRQR
jgi:hypothetical protein